MDTLVRVFLFALVFIAVVGGNGGSFLLSEGEKDQQSAPDERVMKTAVSYRMRLVFLVGLEGSGHHYLHASLKHVFAKNSSLQRLNKFQLQSAYYLTRSMTENPSTYADARARARIEMRNLSLQGDEITPPGSIAFLTGGPCPACSELSYPSFGGAEKVQQYIDVRMLAEVAEAEGVDLRLVYLKRSARDMVIANTQHRSFQNNLGERGAPSAAERYMKYMRILFTDIAAIHSGLNELRPGFVVCHDFGDLGDSKQATRIAEFISPSIAMANMTSDALLGTIKHHDERHENLMFDDANIVIMRLQQKLDVMESRYCG